MIRKKLVFTKKDRIEIDRLIEKLDHIEIDSNDLSPITAGGCGEQCMITCAHYCQAYCEDSCKGTCGFICEKTCTNGCQTTCAGVFHATLEQYYYSVIVNIS